MSDSGNVNVGDDAKVYGPAIGRNDGEVNTTYNITHKHEYASPPPLDLAAAQARFEALPVATVPNVAPLPAGSRMPLSRNSLFVGRAPELLAIATSLKSDQTAAVTGLGGIGKTQLAVE